ncbi:cytochrome c oxidase assembly protein [Zafaria sp. J156]|uniref:cytochrome c oxidase assembly protein n=1 Tax=Zafaria sp. J156 TaxID=3116490 RepID=UPI002E7662CF|nr:cytochrome c oxidase assembly protein [Zafaria sp. J156]MEE1622583.1 cytochrome c oxidase assembly protein [Zafaria sp. J156]
MDATTGHRTADGRLWPVLALPALAAGAVGLVAALLYSGSAAAGLLSDPGALTRWGLPVAKTVHHASMALAIGALVFAAAILPRSRRPERAGRAGRGGDEDRDAGGDTGGEHPAFTRAMNLAAGAAVVWTLAAAAVLVLTFSDLSGLPLSAEPSYTAAMMDYVLGISVGQAWAWMVLIAAVTASLAFGLRSPGGVAVAAVAALLGVVPISLIGHAAGGDDHWGATNAILLHLVGVCLWVGGIATLAVLADTLGGPAPDRRRAATPPLLAGVVLSRFSALAGISIALVAASGVVSAVIRMDSWADLATPYGGLVAAKALLTVALGALGLLHRTRTIPSLLAGRTTAVRAAWRIVAVEAAIMAAVMGIATALARTAPPVPEELPPAATPARILTGYELPPELVPSSWLSEWRFDWLWVAVVLFLGAAYLVAYVRLKRRGDAWPAWRLASWFVGLAALFYITSGAPAVYGMVLFSMHMVGHMALTMVAPFFLVIGSPVTLALKALPSRTDGTRGPREWILVLVHSGFSKIVTHPLFAAANFAGSIIIFYNTELFGFALREHIGHELMNLHFLLTGYIFALNMIGSDPLPRRAAYPLRLLILLATMSFHAFYGVSIMGSESLMQAGWFGNMGRDWGATPLEDQRFGAGAMWGIGEVPTLLLALGVMVAWSRDDARESKRKDRAADRDDDAELAAYNAMFAQLKQHDDETERRGR